MNGRVHNRFPDLVRCANRDSPAHGSSGEQRAECVRLVASPSVCIEFRRPSELGGDDDQRAVEESMTIKIVQQGRKGLVQVLNQQGAASECHPDARPSLFR